MTLIKSCPNAVCMMRENLKCKLYFVQVFLLIFAVNIDIMESEFELKTKLHCLQGSDAACIYDSSLVLDFIDVEMIALKSQD